MSIQRIIGTIFLSGALLYAFFLGRDLIRLRAEMKAECGKLPLLLGLEAFVYFVCTLGVSDFLLNTLIVKKWRLSDDQGLPSCLIASTVVPGGIIAFSFLNAEGNVDALTLVLFMATLALGGFFGGRAVNRMSGSIIKKVMGIALICSLAALVLKMVVTEGAAGTLTGLRDWRLAVMCVLCILIGFINMLGVPTKPAMTAILLLLGLSPLTVLTLVLVLGVITPMSGGISIVRVHRYSRKLVLSAMTAGSISAVIGCLLAISLNALVLNILLMVVMVIAIISILKK